MFMFFRLIHAGIDKYKLLYICLLIKHHRKRENQTIIKHRSASALIQRIAAMMSTVGKFLAAQLRVPYWNILMKKHSTLRGVVLVRRRLHLSLQCQRNNTFKLSVERGRGKKYMNEQLYYISNVVCSKKEYSSQDWENIFKEILAKGDYVTPSNITAMIIGICMGNDQFTVASSLMKYLSQLNSKINIATLSKYLRLCHESWPISGEATILHFYKQLCSQTSIMDANTSENVILAISKTSCWKETLEHLETMKVTCTPGVLVYSAIIEAAFRNGDHDTGWRLAKEATSCNRKPIPSIYSAWLKYCMDHDHTQSGAEIMLNYLSENDIAIPIAIAKEINTYMESLPDKSWKGKLAEIRNSGICSSCCNRLQPIGLTQEQFEKLRSTFLSKVVLGKDIFTKSTPSEIKAFRSFVEQSYPYNVVIDGLNVAYSTGATGKAASKFQSNALRRVIEQFMDEGHDIMVLGRKHMLSWPKGDISFIKQYTRLFLASDLSQDDPLILYAALYGGPKTSFVSRDLMRGHAFRLGDPELAHLFRRWQQWRQYQVRVSKISGKVTV
ncbi:hypothetical protein B566_EDAN014489, partial [Ephemera danica]